MTGKRVTGIPKDALYLRRAELLLKGGDKILRLSELRFRFSTAQEDEESPNNCNIRVYNVAPDTQNLIQKEYSEVILQAGYEKGAFGVIFKGTLKQFRFGRENATTTYMDLLCADGDLAYNFAMCMKSAAAGTTRQERVNMALSAMNDKGVSAGQLVIDATGGTLPRGKVLFGLSRGLIRAECQSMGATWSIQNGKVNVIPLTGYLPGEAVVLNSATGLIGRAEQTADGIQCRCLLNPKIVVGGLIQIDNASINQTVQKEGQGPSDGAAQLAYNQYAGLQQFANVAADGLYRVFVAEFHGDTRGSEWYVDIIALSVNPVTGKVKAYG